jgi:hypothetical protein
MMWLKVLCAIAVCFERYCLISLLRTLDPDHAHISRPWPAGNTDFCLRFGGHDGRLFVRRQPPEQ